MLAALMAIRRARQRSDAEDVPMPPIDAPGFEFKVVRSVTDAFRDRVKRPAALVEEATAGWELFEVIDDRRLRLRRAASWRTSDADRPFDPYRTVLGVADRAQVLRALAMLFGGLVALAAGIGGLSLVIK